MEAVIAGVLRVHVKRTIKGCDCGWAELGKSHWDHQAAAVLDALTDGGMVEWAVRWHVGGCSGINKCMNKRHAERQAEKLVESGHVAVVASRLTLPWSPEP